MVFNLQSSATKHSQQWQNGFKDGLQSDQSNTWNCVEWGVSKRSEYLCQGKPRYRFVRSSVFRKIFPTEIVLGFNLWGRGVVPRKCILAGTLLKPSWNYLGTFAEACWNHVGICRNLARTFLKLWLEPPGTILTARWETLVAFRFGAYCFRFFFCLLASFQCFLALLNVLGSFR